MWVEKALRNRTTTANKGLAIAGGTLSVHVLCFD